MRINFFEGFKKTLAKIANIMPQHAGEAHLGHVTFRMPIIASSGDGEDYQIKANVRYKIIRKGDSTVEIMDISYPDERFGDLGIADFPHGDASPDAGNIIMISRKSFDDAMKPEFPPPEAAGGLGSLGM